MASENVRHRKLGETRTTKLQTTSSSDSESHPPFQKFQDELVKVKEEALAAGLTQEEFNSCLNTAAKRSKFNLSKGGVPSKNGQSCRSRVSLCLKVLWICVLLVLALALSSAAFKPVMFFMHKLLHSKMYQMTRPVRLAIIGALPYLQTIGMDSFFTNDCILENPLLNETQRCPCLSIKHPVELALNGTPFPLEILQQPVLRHVYVLRNATQFPSDLNLGKVVSYPDSHGNIPLVCWQITSENSKGVVLYNQLFEKPTIKKLLRRKDPWAFTWKECPDSTNPTSLRDLFPPLTFNPPPTHTSTDSMFTITTQWAPSTHQQDMFPDGEVIALQVVGGEVRIVPHPQDAACFEVCSGFKGHVVLRPGDVFLFDQRLWTYEAYTWTKTALMYSVAIEYD